MPVYKNDDGEWEIQIYCWRNDFIEDSYYELKIDAVNDNGSIQLTMVKDCNKDV